MHCVLEITSFLKILPLEREVETNVNIKINSSGFVSKLTGKITSLTGSYNLLDVTCLERAVN